MREAALACTADSPLSPSPAGGAGRASAPWPASPAPARVTPALRPRPGKQQHPQLALLKPCILESVFNVGRYATY